MRLFLLNDEAYTAPIVIRTNSGENHAVATSIFTLNGTKGIDFLMFFIPEFFVQIFLVNDTQFDSFNEPLLIPMNFDTSTEVSKFINISASEKIRITKKVRNYLDK